MKQSKAKQKECWLRKRSKRRRGERKGKKKEEESVYAHLRKRARSEGSDNRRDVRSNNMALASETKLREESKGREG